MSKNILAKTYKQEDIDFARRVLINDYFTEPAPMVYTILRKVSPSGMSRVISLVFPHENRIASITHLAAKVLKVNLIDVNGHWGIRRDGCGMDMGFDLVYSLSCALYCPDKYDHDSAYRLRHEWL